MSDLRITQVSVEVAMSGTTATPKITQVYMEVAREKRDVLPEPTGGQKLLIMSSS